MSNEGIAPLNTLPNLGALDVSQTAVTNPAIVKLNGRKNWNLFYRDLDDRRPLLIVHVP